MSELFNTIFFKPILNLLVVIYNTVAGNDLGIAIILLTIVIKLLLFPLSQKALHSQKALQSLQPKLEELKKKYKDKREKLAQEMMKLYKEEKVNPLSSCLPLLIQLPFLIAVFRVFSHGIENDISTYLYSSVEEPGVLDTTFAGFFDLSGAVPLFGVIAGIGQWYQTKMLVAKRPEVAGKGARDEDMMAMVNKQMTFMLPVITVVLGFTFPGGLMLYWLITTLLTIIQQKFLFREKQQQKEEIPQAHS